MTLNEQRAWALLTADMAGGAHQYDYWEDVPEDVRRQYLDRNLFERAARAYGIELVWSSEPGWAPKIKGNRMVSWNPRDNDGDAFRLAVKLSLFDDIERRASAIAGEVNYDMDVCEAFRIAILRAAAERAPEAA